VSKSSRLAKSILAIALLSIVAATFCPLATFATDPNSATTLHEFLHTFYPELFGKGRYLDVTAFQPIDSSWREVYETSFRVTDGPPVPGNPTIDLVTGARVIPNANLAMEGFFQVTPGGQIERLYVWNSQFVRSKENEEFHKLVQTHLDWSETDALRALKGAGALYGSDDKEAFLNAINLERFKSFLGHLKLVSAKLNGFSNPNHVGDFAQFYWSVEVDAQSADGTHREYALSFEPFEGRLIGLKHLP
jgi:hypothetical protein